MIIVCSADLINSAHTQTLAEKGNFCVRVLTWLDALAHGVDGIYFCQKLACDAATASYRDSERDVATNRCVYSGQGADFTDPPV